MSLVAGSKHCFLNAPFAYASGEVLFAENRDPQDYVFHAANTAFTALLPAVTGSLAGRRGSEIGPILIGDSLDWLSRFAAVALSGDALHFDVRSAGPGTWFRLTVTSAQRGFFEIIAVDITDLKKSGRNPAEQGRESENRRYYHAFQSTSQPILITDGEGLIVSVNKSFCAMYGYSAEELIGQNPRVLNPGREVYENLGISVFEYESRFRELWRSVLDPGVGTWQGEVINRARKGNLVWVNLMVNAVHDERGKLQTIVGMPIDMTDHRELSMENRVQTYRTIADMAELRDDDTGNHLKRVGIFAKLLARELGMREKYCGDIELFAPLHDIGKVGILDSILRAPRRLTDDEFEIMKTHAQLGHNIVKGKPEFEMAAAITLCHHERYDGTGYPNGLEGKHIPLSAHITAVCDVYDALRSRRPYKEAWSHERVVRYFHENSGTHFDPDIVHVFLKLHDRFDTVYRELMDP